GGGGRGARERHTNGGPNDATGEEGGGSGPRGAPAAARHTNARSGDRALFAAQSLGRSRASGSRRRRGGAGGRKLPAEAGPDDHGREPEHWRPVAIRRAAQQLL